VPVYFYTFARAIPGLEALGATHGVELPYVFGTLANPGAADVGLSDAMQAYWARFAKTGDPNGEGATDWPPFVEATDQRMNLDVEPYAISGFRRAECHMWSTIYDAAFP
jgi:para-nitrobenzyl esterase